MFNRKNKAVTFSYDDGVTQDIRLIKLFNKYGLRATFNLNSELLGKSGSLLLNGAKISHDKVKAQDVKYIYEGHEIAVHTLTHPRLPDIADDDEIVRQVEEDRIKLSEMAGYEVRGMAYPCGGVNNDERTAEIIRARTGVSYARALETNGSFELQKDLYRFKGTVYHHGEWDKLFELGEKFISYNDKEPAVFYIWGHSYEFDIYPERWKEFEGFLEMISGREDVFYGTNKEILLDSEYHKINN